MASRTSTSKWVSIFRQVGPGIAIAATGVGAADLVTVSVAGSKYGNALMWAVIVGATLKFVLNESIARWQLATGLTVFEGWSRYLGRGVTYLFLAYLVVWTILVSGGLIVASGLAAHTLVPAISREAWGVIHAVAGYLLILAGSYQRFEQLMKTLIAMMFVAIVGCALAARPSYESIIVLPRVPPGSLTFTLGLIGGVGGSVTMLAYGYWIGEKKWVGTGWLTTVRTDLGIGYGLTGCLGIGVMLLSAEVLFKQGIEVEGPEGVIRMALMLKDSMGLPGQWIFMIGFWGAVFTSMLGIFQGIPYLFADFMFCLSGRPPEARGEYVHPRSLSYRLFLTFMALPCMLMLFVERPIWIIVLYAAVSALFLPPLALTLLYLNNRSDLIGKRHRNGPLANLVLVATVVLFLYLGFDALLGGP